MDAGKRQERISIESRSGSETSLGSLVDTWSLSFQRWAAVKGIRGAESQPSGVPTYAGTFRFTMVKPTPITPNQRIVWKGRPHNIIAVDDSSLHEVVVTAVDGQQGGA